MWRGGLFDIAPTPTPHYFYDMFLQWDQKALRNVIGGFLAAYGWVSFFCFIGLVRYWATTAPTMPDPVKGLIFPHNEHGLITFFSAFQGTSCALLFATSIPLGFLGILIGPKKNVISRSGTLWFSAKWEQDDPQKLAPWAMACGAISAPILVFLIGPPLVNWLNSIGVVTGF